MPQRPPKPAETVLDKKQSLNSKPETNIKL